MRLKHLFAASLLVVALLPLGAFGAQAAPPQPRPNAAYNNSSVPQTGIIPEGATMAPAPVANQPVIYGGTAAPQPQAAVAPPQYTTVQAGGLALPSAAPTIGSGAEYVLGTGDKIKVTVFNETDLSGEFDIDSTGMLAMPLVGQIQAANLTQRQLSTSIQQRLAEGYLKDPKVSVEVMNYRPFFILGEVMKPGSYPYVNGMTVVNAVALAGGYTYRGEPKDITVVRASDPARTEQKVGETGTVLPGDIVRVPEKFF